MGMVYEGEDIRLGRRAALKFIPQDVSGNRKDDQPWRTLVSSGYVKRPDGWKLAFHQQTPLD